MFLAQDSLDGLGQHVSVSVRARCGDGQRWVAGEAAYLKEAARGLKRPYNELRRDHRLDSTRSLVCFGKIADRSLCTDNVFNYGT